VSEFPRAARPEPSIRQREVQPRVTSFLALIRTRPGCYPEDRGVRADLPFTTRLEPGSRMNKLIFANLIHRSLRSIISVLAVAIEVVMILSIVAIFMGMLNDQKQRTNGIGADLVIRPSNASFMTSVGGAPMPARIAEVFRRMPHVAAAAPVITNFSMTGNVEVLYGIDYSSYNALKPFIWVAGGPFQRPYDVIIDDVFGRTGNGYSVGGPLTIFNHPF